MEERKCAVGPSRTRGSARKGAIREVLRKIFDEAGDNPSNMNRAWDLLKVRLPDARRSRVREVLREPEFATRRRRPGRKATPRPSEPHRTAGSAYSDLEGG
jgi:hypothetical protein